MIMVPAIISRLMPLAEVKNHLSEVADQVEHEHGRVVITKHGQPAVIVLSIGDLESLEETLDVMGSETLLCPNEIKANSDRKHRPDT